MPDETGNGEPTATMSAGAMPVRPIAVPCGECGTELQFEAYRGVSGMRCTKCDRWYTLAAAEPSQSPVATDNPYRYQRPEVKPRKIAIIGKAPSSMMMAPYDDEEWEVWSINDSMYRKMIKRCDRQFELHNIELTKQPGYDDYYDWLKATDVPVYVNADYPEIKSRVIFPRYEIVERFPIFRQQKHGDKTYFVEKGCTYYTNSISYLIALAIYELTGVEKDSWIGLWGVDMAQHGKMLKSEFAHQRPSCELFVGAAIGAGINVVIPDECDLLKTKNMYGFDTYGEMQKKCITRINELEGRIGACRKEADAKAREADFLEGAHQDMQYIMQWF
jgi:hypothetical protein